MIVVIRPELAPLLVELLDVHLESGQRERVKAAALREWRNLVVVDDKVG